MRGLRIVLMAALAGACATVAPNPRAETESPSWPTLARFSSEAEFLGYIDDVAAARRALERPRHSKQTEDENCPPDDPDCLPEEEDRVVVTGSRIPSPPPPPPAMAPAPAASTDSGAADSITNVQTSGVDEGDIIKMIGRFLIVLQDGRLFSIDTGESARDLRLTDRANVYRHPGADVWYDEILVHANRIVATGYNYGEDATEFSVFTLNEAGRFAREAVYYLSSDDYYDVENYATRLVDGHLVIYTPLDVSSISRTRRPEWPLVRRWLHDNEREAVTTRGRALFDGGDIFRPIQATLQPMVHTISVCPLGSARAGDELDCRSTAIAGEAMREFYVSNDHVYLWLSPGYNYYAHRRGDAEARCEARAEDSFGYASEAALFQISLRDGRPRAMFVRGMPYDHLGMEATPEAFRALAVWVDHSCADRPDDLPLRYFSTPLRDFSTRPRRAGEARFTPLPNPGGRGLENRFTATHLVYGARENWGSYPPRGAEDLNGRVVAVPSNNPAGAVVIDTPHNIIRVESIGFKAVLTGYRNDEALSISVLDLRGAPRIADTATLASRYESEGRSHAFNASVNADGAGLMGLPTVAVERRAGRWWWNSEASDVSFLSLDADGTIRPLGELSSNAEENTDPKYECEVSCIDWYGNSRPVFARGRVFALSGTELIEGAVGDGRIGELARVNLTGPVRR